MINKKNMAKKDREIIAKFLCESCKKNVASGIRCSQFICLSCSGLKKRHHKSSKIGMPGMYNKSSSKQMKGDSKT